MQEYSKFEELTESLKQYVNTTYELHKLKAIERSSTIGSVVIGSVLTGIAVLLFILFASLYAGFWLSSLLADNWSGFGIVAGFWLLISLIMILSRRRMIEKPMRDKIIRKAFSKI